MNKQSRIERWVRPEIREIAAYHVASSAGLLKMDAMENPYSYPEELWDEVAADLRKASINRYPDPSAAAVRDALKNMYGLDESTDILFGNGSDELIQILAMVLGGPGRTILSVEPSFVMYRMIATFTGSDYVGVPLTDSFEIDLSAVRAAILEKQPSLIFIAQPNNPTGNLFSDDALREILEMAPGLVVIDEAYTAFTNADYLGWLKDHDNLVVMRTFSKVGLAGLRFGMLFGDPLWLRELDKVRLPYNINVLTQSMVLNAINHFSKLTEQTEDLRVQRAALQAALEKFSAIKVFPSEANFLLVRLPHSARAVFESMKTKGVLIKCLDGGHPMLAGCLRFTVGTSAENEIMLKAFSAACREAEIS